jgi:hypothetical protein
MVGYGKLTHTQVPTQNEQQPQDEVANLDMMPKSTIEIRPFSRKNTEISPPGCEAPLVGLDNIVDMTTAVTASKTQATLYQIIAVTRQFEDRLPRAFRAHAGSGI